MGDIGIKISQPFVDANSAADYQYIFNSAYPSITIAYEQTLTATLTSSGYTPTITHGLGFAPFTMMWTTINGYNLDFRIPRITTTQCTSDNFSYSSFIDPTTGSPFGSDVTATFHFKCYNIDLSKPRDYAFVKAPVGSVPYSPDVGMKIAKEGKSIDSTDLRDYILHTRAQAPLVLSVITEASQLDAGGGVYNISYTNPAGYVAWAFGMASTSGDPNTYYWGNVNAQSPPRLYYENGGTKFRLSYTGTKAAIVVLRDPLFAATDVNVSY